MSDDHDDHDHGDAPVHENEDGPDHDDTHGHDHDESHDHDQSHDHDHEDAHDHDHHKHDISALGVAILTVSSSRSLDDDPAGDAIAVAFEEDGHEVVTRDLVRDDYDSIQGTMQRLVSRDDTGVVVSTGGTGITPDDVTVEAVRPLFDKQLPGFGELFRTLSRDEIGTRVIGTRATAGVTDGVPVFCLPGSENAAKLGANDIIVPEAPHLTGLTQRD